MTKITKREHAKQLVSEMLQDETMGIVIIDTLDESLSLRVVESDCAMNRCIVEHHNDITGQVERNYYYVSELEDLVWKSRNCVNNFGIINF